MATTVITNASVVVNSVDLSDHVKSVKVTNAQDMKEDTAMGATVHTMKPGLGKPSITIEFFQDRASSKVDATLAPLVGGVGVSAVTVVIKAVNTTVGATNPTWTMTQAFIDGDYNGVDGKVGELETVGVKFVCGSGGSLVRATS